MLNQQWLRYRGSEFTLALVAIDKSIDNIITIAPATVAVGRSSTT